MATLATTHPTLMDLAKRLDPDGKIDKIAEILTQVNEVLIDMPWAEGNLPTGHRSTIRTGIPEPTWRKLYGGVQPTKSETAQITDTCGMLEAYAEVDVALADLNGNTESFRLSEDKAHLEGMSQSFASALFYESEAVNPERITGFSPRYSSAVPGTPIADNIVLAGPPEGNDNASIWLVGWGENTAFGIYPKGSKAGLQSTDKGQVTLENVDGNGGRMEAYRTHYRWDVGLCVRDWRYVVRGQYDQEDLVRDAATGPNLINLMTDMVSRPPSLSNARFAWYANRKAMTFLRNHLTNAVKNSTLTQEMISGRPVLHFDGIPVRRCDALLNTEVAIPTS